MVDPELLWSSILSRDPDQIRAMWHTLSTEEQVAVHAHLVTMTTDTGWTEPQRVSAQAALDTLQQLLDSGDRAPGT